MSVLAGMDRNRVIFLALAALQDVADESARGPIEPTIHLRALLGLLHLQSNGDRRCYDEFWRAVCRPNRPDEPEWSENYVRQRDGSIALIGIGRTVGLELIARETHKAIGKMLYDRRMARCADGGRQFGSWGRAP